MTYQGCVMGCKREAGKTYHVFPSDAQRRAEWCRILGVYPRAKRVFLCSAHIPDCYINGNRLSKYALPNPPDWRTLNNLTMAIRTGKANYLIQPKYDFFTIPKPKIPEYKGPELSENTMPELFDDNSVTTFPDTEISFPATKIKSNNLVEDPLQNNSSFQFFSEFENETEEPPNAGNETEEPSNAGHETDEPQEPFSKVEDFEIRNGINKDMIIKGRYVQTNDYLVVNYTPPTKWYLQEQVKILDKTCVQQLNNIKQLNKENYRLSLELIKRRKLLPKLEFLQTHNRYIYSQLKKYKINEKNRRKRINEKRLKNEKVATLEENDIES